LYKVLSLMKCVLPCIDFMENRVSKDISSWLASKKLLTVELLDEICLYKTRYDFSRKNPVIYRFAEDNNCYCDENLLKKYLCDFIKNAFKNVIFYEYFLQNNAKMNDYIFELTAFWEKNLDNLPKHSIDFSLKSVLEMDCKNLFNQINFLDEILIFLDTKLTNIKEWFCLECTNSLETEHLCECIRPELELNFSLSWCRENLFYKKIEKYLELGVELTQKRQQIKKACQYEIHLAKEANFCFLNRSQILYMNLDYFNCERLNKQLRAFYGQQYFSEIFYFDLNKGSALDFLNYAQLCLN